MMLRLRKFSVFAGFAAMMMALAVAAVSLMGAQQPASSRKQGAAGDAASAGTTNAEFAAAADEVLHQMSEITGLKLLTPLKKSLRSREQIRAYVINEMKEDKDQAERYAGERSAEAFGLLPKGFDLDNFMIDLLTEQIAGLYDPKTHEFYVADWIPAADQKMVMAHELTHALQDQHFKIDNWVKAARPNDDAELARESVLEGSAMAAMVDYLLAGTGRSLQDLPDIDPSMLVGDMESTPMLKKAPAVFARCADFSVSRWAEFFRGDRSAEGLGCAGGSFREAADLDAADHASGDVFFVPDSAESGFALARQGFGLRLGAIGRQLDGGVWLEGSSEAVCR